MIQSIVILLGFGLAASALFRWMRLPGLLGMAVVGVIAGPYGLDVLDGSILGCAADVRMMALVVILLRGGLGLNKDTLKRVGWVAIKMSALPCLAEGFTAALTAHKVLGLPLVEAAILGFVLAACTPAVVVPAMLDLQERGWGVDKGVPVIVMAGASADDVFAITLFSVFLTMAARPEQSLLLQLGRIPWQIAGGILVGALLALALSRLCLSRMRLADTDCLALVLLAGLGAQVIGDRYDLGLLGVMVLGYVLQDQAAEAAASVERPLHRIWFFAEVFLFALVGAQLDVTLALQAGALGLVVIAAGLAGRSAGVMVALHGSALNVKEKLFCAMAYIPKATVQAAIGGIPLAMGLPSGALILTIAVLSIVVTAPLGAMGIRLLAPRLLRRGDRAATT